MNGVYVYLRNREEYSAVLCNYNENITFHRIKVFYSYDNAISVISSIRSSTTADLIGFLKANGVDYIIISVNGPFKPNTILDLNMLKANGIEVKEVLDYTMPERDHNAVKEALERASR